MSILPPSYANAATPFFAGTKCGNITQTETFNTDGSEPVVIGFTDAATWSDTQSFTPDNDGIIWECQTSGVYNLRFNQTYTVENQYVPPTSTIAVIPNSTFYLDLSGFPVVPATGDLILHNIEGSQSNISSANAGSTILMATFITPVGFLTTTVIPGGLWNASVWAATTDDTEANSLTINVYSVDADGVSNPVLVYDGDPYPILLNGAAIYNYNSLLNTATFQVADLTKRIQIQIFAIYTSEVESTINIYFRGNTQSNITTTITQDVVPLTQDTVNARITVDALTSEFNQVFASSVPINIADGETLTYSSSVNAIANVYRGDTVTCSLVSDQGRVLVTSGQTTRPSPPNTLQWNLIAEGAYGNANVIAAPGPMMFSAPVVTVEATPDPIITSTTEISQVVLDLRNAI
jgi:hypothetical protein